MQKNKPRLPKEILFIQIKILSKIQLSIRGNLCNNLYFYLPSILSIRVRGRVIMRDGTLKVIRIGRRKMILMSKPCITLMNATISLRI